MGRRLVSVFVLSIFFASAVEASSSARNGPAGLLQSDILKSIVAWLKASGREGYLAADVADAAGIPRSGAEAALDARQRGFRSEGILRIAQIPSDGKRDFLL